MCDQASAGCICKENVQGQSCETCVPGTFNLSPDNPKGCTDCFCFGTTEQCSSSYWSKADVPILSSPDSTWTIVGDGVTINEITDALIEAVAEEGKEASGEIYFALPSSWTIGESRILWYGSVLSYEMEAVGSGEITVTPDAILKGNNRSLHYWSREQPANPGKKFQISIPMDEKHWKEADDGGSVSRGDLMMILHRMESLQLKV